MERPLHLPSYFQKDDFKALYKVHGQQKKGVRLLALRYLQEGKSLKDTAILLLKSEYTLRKWIRLYEEAGINGLLSTRPGQGKKTKLSRLEEGQLKEEITKHVNSLKGGRLKGKDIKRMIRLKFNVDYSLSGIYPLLHCLDYSWVIASSAPPKANKNLPKTFNK